MKVVEAGKLQSAQVPLVTEAVMARAALLTIGQCEDISVEHGPLLDIITDTDKFVFYQDKFINSASAPCLYCLSTLSSLVTSMLTYFPDKITSVLPLYRCAAFSLVSPCVRTIKNLCGIGKTLVGAGVVCRMLIQLLAVNLNSSVRSFVEILCLFDLTIDTISFQAILISLQKQDHDNL